MARHGSFVDGAEYFDNKFFGLSVMEAKANGRVIGSKTSRRST